MIVDPRTLDAAGDSLALDPFAFWPNLASRIEGVGGDEPGDVPDYAFHTLYLGCGTARVTFIVEAGDLAAERGTLILRIHELPDFVGADARQVAISQTQMTDMIRQGGSASLSVDTEAGNSYAILGHIHGDTRVTARTLGVIARRSVPDADDPTRPSDFVARTDRIGMVPQLVSMHEPTLAAPVSQHATAGRLREHVFAQWDQHLPHGTPLERWERVFIARTLERYDVARVGARGLAIGAAGGTDDPLIRILDAAGCRMMAAGAGADLVDGISAMAPDWWPADTCAGMAGFDFCYATCPPHVTHIGRQRLLGGVEDMLRTLKPGGLTIAILPFDATPRDVLDPEAGPVPGRRDVERIGLLLVSRGHQVAQLCFGGSALTTAPGKGTLSRFALVVRRAI